MEIPLFPSSAPVKTIWKAVLCLDVLDGSAKMEEPSAKDRWPGGTWPAGRRCPLIEMEWMTDIQMETSSGHVDCGPGVEGKCWG